MAGDYSMPITDLLVYRVATTSDAESLAALINDSYRSEVSKQGWTDENGLIFGPRTNENQLFNMINDGKSVFLIFSGGVDHVLKGCINVRHEAETKTANLGMFAVRPDLQNRGYGKFILSTAENYAISNWKVQKFELCVFIQRTELISYYNRRGYIDTGRRQPLRQHQMELGTILRDDLEMCTMNKFVKTDDNKTV